MQGYDPGYRIGMPSGAAHCRNHRGSGFDGDGHEIPELPRPQRDRLVMESSDTTLFVCVTCRAQTTDAPQADLPRPGARLLAAINAVPEAQRAGLVIEPVECLSNCNRSCTVAVSAPGKWTYVLGTLDPDLHVDDVLTFARAHRAHEAGLPAWRTRPEYIRKNTISRVPPLPSRAPDEVSSQ